MIGRIEMKTVWSLGLIFSLCSGLVNAKEPKLGWQKIANITSIQGETTYIENPKPRAFGQNKVSLQLLYVFAQDTILIKDKPAARYFTSQIQFDCQNSNKAAFEQKALFTPDGKIVDQTKVAPNQLEFKDTIPLYWQIACESSFENTGIMMSDKALAEKTMKDTFDPIQVPQFRHNWVAFSASAQVASFLDVATLKRNDVQPVNAEGFLYTIRGLSVNRDPVQSMHQMTYTLSCINNQEKLQIDHVKTYDQNGKLVLQVGGETMPMYRRTREIYGLPQQAKQIFLDICANNPRLQTLGDASFLNVWKDFLSFNPDDPKTHQTSIQKELAKVNHWEQNQ